MKRCPSVQKKAAAEEQVYDQPCKFIPSTPDAQCTMQSMTQIDALANTGNGSKDGLNWTFLSYSKNLWQLFVDLVTPSLTP